MENYPLKTDIEVIAGIIGSFTKKIPDGPGFIKQLEKFISNDKNARYCQHFLHGQRFIKGCSYRIVATIASEHSA